MAKWNIRLGHGMSNDGSTKLNNAIKPHLNTAGLKKIPHQGWVGYCLEAKEVAEGLSKMFDCFSDPSLTPADQDVVLTSLWMHIEPCEDVED